MSRGQADIQITEIERRIRDDAATEAAIRLFNRAAALEADARDALRRLMAEPLTVKDWTLIAKVGAFWWLSGPGVAH